MIYRKIAKNDYPWSLLLEADPSRERVQSYLHTGECVGVFDADLLVGVFVLVVRESHVAELMNIAVASPFRGRGYGKRLLQECVRRARAAGLRKLEVGTCNSSLDQLGFYQKCGFRIVGVERDFFVLNYSEPIEEHGIRCRDMIRLSKEID